MIRYDQYKDEDAKKIGKETQILIIDHLPHQSQQKSTHVNNLVWDITKWIHDIDIKSNILSYYPPNFDSVMT